MSPSERGGWAGISSALWMYMFKLGARCLRELLMRAAYLNRESED